MTPEQIIGDVACQTGIPVAFITGKRRVRPIVNARTLAIQKIHNHFPYLSLLDIADFFKISSHKAITYHLRRKLTNL